MGPGFGLMGADLSADQLKELMETLKKYDSSQEIPEKKRLAPVCGALSRITGAMPEGASVGSRSRQVPS